MNTKNAALSALLAAPLLTVSAHAQAMTQVEALTRLVSAAEIKAEWFAPEFLQQVPLSVIQSQFNSINAQFGKFVRLDTLNGRVLAVYERGSLIVTSAPVDDQGRLASFGAVPGPDPHGEPAMTPEQQQVGVKVLEQIMTVNPVDTSLFSAEFLSTIPADTLAQMFREMRGQMGDFKSVTAQEKQWVLNFEKGQVPVTALTLDTPGKITGLRLGTASVNFRSLDEAKAAFTALPGDVSVFVKEISPAGATPSPLLAVNATRPMGIGSTFKLAILGEVQARVNAGALKWTDEVTLTDAMKSLPSGTLQDAPAGSKYTVQDLATRMIRDSDNTATDLLLDLAGREGVEARLGQKAMPSTRELFALKKPANIELLRAYRAAGLNTTARREVLKQAGTAPLPTAADFDGTRTLARDVEWFVSTERLCQLMTSVAALPAMQLNPGVVSRDDYTSVSYKGGSEPGVLNLTTQVTSKAGKTYCVSATWNDSQPLNEATFVSLYKGLLDYLR